MTGEVRSTPGSAYNFLTNADMQFPTITDENGNTRELDDSAFYLFMRANDRRVRRDAYDAHRRHVLELPQHRRRPAERSGTEPPAERQGARLRETRCRRRWSARTSRPRSTTTSSTPSTTTSICSTAIRNLRVRTLDLDDGVHAYDLFAPLVAGSGDRVRLRPERGDDPRRPQAVGRRVPHADEEGVRLTLGRRPSRPRASVAVRIRAGPFLTQPYILLNYHGSYEDTSTLAH